jgi:tetratricopeptide (TPR) repeat protein/GTP-binding protein EngB required for normal cell division
MNPFYDDNGKIKGITIDDLIMMITSHDKSEHLNTFMLTYRTFMTPETLLILLIKRYNDGKNKKDNVVMLRVISIIKLWIKEYTFDFIDEGIKKIILSFMTDAKFSKDYFDILDFKVEKKRSRTHNKQTRIKQYNCILDISDIEVAKQITIMIHNLFKKIKLLDFFTSYDSSSLINKNDIEYTQQSSASGCEINSHIQNKTPFMVSSSSFSENFKYGQTQLSEVQCGTSHSMPNLVHNNHSINSIQNENQYNLININDSIDMIGSFETNTLLTFNNFKLKITHYITYEILKEIDIDKRIVCLEYFISVLNHCYNFNNFDGCMIIIKSLTSKPISRLKKTWDSISLKHQSIFDKMIELFNNKDNYIKLRERIKKGGILIPYTDLFLLDLNYINNTYPDTVDNKINFCKRKLMSDIVEKIKKYQDKTVNFNNDESINYFLSNINLKNTNEFDELSFKCEHDINESYAFIVKRISESVIQEYTSTQKQQDKIYILLGGLSGVGKSSIIKAIFNVDIKTGHGFPQTQHIEKYEWNNSPLVIYDVPGIEFGNEEKYTKEIQCFLDSIENNNEIIHCIWYVISASNARVQEREIEMIKKLYGRIDKTKHNNPFRYKLLILLNKIDTESQKNISIMENTIKDIMNSPTPCPFFVGVFPIIANRNLNAINLEQIPLPSHWKKMPTFSIESNKSNSGEVESLYVHFTYKETGETKIYQINKTEGLDKLTQNTLAILDEMNHKSFIAAQFVSIKLKDTLAKLIIKKYIHNPIKQTELMINELMVLWNSHMSASLIESLGTSTLRQRIISFIRNILINNNRKIFDVITMATIGIATHDFLRSVATLFWNRNEKLISETCIIKQNEYFGFSDKLQLFREHIVSESVTDIEFLNSYVDSLWNETTPDTIIERNEIEMYKYRAKKAKECNDYAGAIEIYNKAIENFDSEPTFYANRSYLHLLQNNATDALSDAFKVIELNPNWYVGYFRKGQALLKKHFFWEAINCFEKCLSMNEDCEIEIRIGLSDAKKGYARVQFDEAKHYLNKGDINQTIEAATRAITFDPTIPDYYNIRSIAYRHKKDFNRCKLDARMAIKLCPTWVDGYIRLIEGYTYNNENNKASHLIQQIYEQFKGDTGLLQLANSVNSQISFYK